MRKKVTIHDVAKQAGVSIKTVSRVVNREPNVRKSTAERVEEAIRSLGYRPNSSARSLAGSRTFLIGLLYDNPSASYVTKVQDGVLETCRREQYDLLIHPCDYQRKDLADEIRDLVVHSRLDGLILTPPISDLGALESLLAEIRIPHIKIAPGKPPAAHPSVCTNDRSACAEMVAYLAGLGHRRIAFVTGHPDHGAVQRRFDGYLDGLQTAGLKFRKELCAQGYNSFESGEACARELLGMKNRPTAVFSANDDMAAGVMKVAHDMGIDIPGELSVAGFDDIPLAAQIWPALTTIHQPMRGMAEKAAELLIQSLRGPAPEPGIRILESRIVLRQSTGPAPGS